MQILIMNIIIHFVTDLNHIFIRFSRLELGILCVWHSSMYGSHMGPPMLYLELGNFVPYVWHSSMYSSHAGPQPTVAKD